MAARSHSTVVGVFADHQQAQRAVNELRRMGFTEDQIGVAHRNSSDTAHSVPTAHDASDDTYAGEGTAAGLATGAGVGALWGLGIIAGVLPAIGPAIAGGTLAAILSSAAAGAAAAGLGGALIGLGLSKDEADYYNTEFESGRTVVTVSAGARESEAEATLRQFGGYDISHKGDMASTTRSNDMLGNRTAASSSMARESSAMHDSSLTGSTQATDRNRMTAYEEELSVHKHKVDAGDVNIRKEVHTEHKTIDVPVQREEVVIERRPASGESTGRMGGHQEIRIPVSEEQVDVQKRTVAKEDVVVGKRTVQGTQRIDENLRKEEIKVDADEDIRIRDERRNR
jgi:uncharacterized protein (TIGR02271 family)